MERTDKRLTHTFRERFSEASGSRWVPLGLFKAVQLMKVLSTHWPRPLHFYPETLKLLMLSLHHWTLRLEELALVNMFGSDQTGFISAECCNVSHLIQFSSCAYTIIPVTKKNKYQFSVIAVVGFLNPAPVKTQTHEYYSDHAYAPLALLLKPVTSVINIRNCKKLRWTELKCLLSPAFQIKDPTRKVNGWSIILWLNQPEI